MLQRTLVLIKPDAMQRGLVGEILSRLERRGLKIVGLKLIKVDEGLARRHYAEHEGKGFFPGLIGFITSTPIVAVVLEGRAAVDVVRKSMGETDASKASPGTIRGDLGIDLQRNLIHGSDSVEKAQQEIALFFSPEEILAYPRSVDHWVSES